ncbi:hypothetical protein RB195_004328 [Necator americanus]|uniref:G protein-coupled receptor n=1 Tax=Necator americanus TaxID=51031 RepID=A0ABR1BHF6_NECAM
MCTSHRLFLVAARFCCIAQRNAPIVTHLLLVQDAGINIASFGMLFVVIERAIASRFTTTYEVQCTGFIVPSLLCSTVALIVIVLVNISLYRQRHHFMMDLTNKYQMDENIRVCRYLIPVAINNVMTQVVFILLIAYSVFFTDIPLGHDTSYLSHAYDLLLAYERDFFVIALVLRSQKFDQLVKRRRRTSKVVEMEAAAAATSDHFNSLKKMWS